MAAYAAVASVLGICVAYIAVLSKRGFGKKDNDNKAKYMVGGENIDLKEDYNIFADMAEQRVDLLKYIQRSTPQNSSTTNEQIFYSTLKDVVDSIMINYNNNSIQIESSNFNPLMNIAVTITPNIMKRHIFSKIKTTKNALSALSSLYNKNYEVMINKLQAAMNNEIHKDSKNLYSFANMILVYSYNIYMNEAEDIKSLALDVILNKTEYNLLKNNQLLKDTLNKTENVVEFINALSIAIQQNTGVEWINEFGDIIDIFHQNALNKLDTINRYMFFSKLELGSYIDLGSKVRNLVDIIDSKFYNNQVIQYNNDNRVLIINGLNMLTKLINRVIKNENNEKNELLNANIAITYLIKRIETRINTYLTTPAFILKLFNKPKPGHYIFNKLHPEIYETLLNKYSKLMLACTSTINLVWIIVEYRETLCMLESCNDIPDNIESSMEEGLNLSPFTKKILMTHIVNDRASVFGDVISYAILTFSKSLVNLQSIPGKLSFEKYASEMFINILQLLQLNIELMTKASLPENIRIVDGVDLLESMKMQAVKVASQLNELQLWLSDPYSFRSYFSEVIGLVSGSTTVINDIVLILAKRVFEWEKLQVCKKLGNNACDKLLLKEDINPLVDNKGGGIIKLSHKNRKILKNKLRMTRDRMQLLTKQKSIIFNLDL